jgi:MFS family permease
MTDLSALDVNEKAQAHRKLLFVACFVALVATAFAFLIRSFILDDLRLVFNLTETQKGEINGAGFWPFAISIVVFSLIIDRIGYGKAMIFAFACHVGSVVLMFMAKGYWTLYFAAVLCALAAGTVEAVVNPVIASMFPKNKTKMLTILHAGWAGGLCLAGILTLSLTPAVTGWIKDLGIALWQLKAGLLLIPTFAYGIMMLFCKFPVNERVVAGVPYKDMLKEAGALSILIVSFMIFKQLGALGLPMWGVVTGVVVCTVAMFAYSGSLGRPMYVFLLLVMILLAITEISTDGWIKDLMGPAMEKLKVGSKEFHLSGGWVLVYTSFLMMLLRFGISPFVKLLKPLGVLLMGSLFAAAGLFFLSGAEGAWWLLLFATVYGIGQAFFWPVTIGLVAEQFPRGGALTLNAIAGVGMLATGIIGFPLLGMLQDRQIDAQLADRPALVAMANPEEKESIFGTYYGLDSNKTNLLVAQENLFKSQSALDDAKDMMAELSPSPAEASAALLEAEGNWEQTVRDSYELILGKGADMEAEEATMIAALTENGAMTLPAGGIEQVKSELAEVSDIRAEAKHKAMAQIAILPLIMAGCYIGLMIYFRAKGGYKAIDLSVDGEVVGSHAVTPAEAVADAEATPSE